MLDANVLIALLDADDAHHDAARSMLEAETDDLAISALTLAEVAVGPARADRLLAVQDAVEALGLRVLPVEAETWDALAQLRASTALRMPDCCVLHTGLARHASVATCDRQLATAARAAGLTAIGS
ncbi:MAG: type II toxin-antitoxin system VapC family toxin [Actinomycetes bacterium]